MRPQDEGGEMRIDVWIIEIPSPKRDVFRTLGFRGAGLFFRTRQEAREFIRQWREDTNDESLFKVIRAALAAKEG